MFLLPRLSRVSRAACVELRGPGCPPVASTLRSHRKHHSLRPVPAVIRPPVSPRRHVASASTATRTPNEAELDAELLAADSEPLAKGSSAGGFTLRPYQEAAITACLRSLDEGITRMGVSSPTGSGKTTMFMKLIPEVVERKGKRKKTLIIVSAVELADQSVNAARRLLGSDWSIEVEQGSKRATGCADV